MADAETRTESDRALVVVDMTLDRFAGPGAIPHAAAAVRYVQGELRYFRERGRPVIFAVGASDAPIIQELTPRTDERIVRRAAPSAFFATDLSALLDRLRVGRVTLVGLETHTSILLTAADALSLGLQVVVPEPCVTSSDLEAHRHALALLRDVWPRTWPRSAMQNVARTVTQSTSLPGFDDALRT